MDTVPEGIIDARSRPPVKAFIEDRIHTNLSRTLGNVAARGWTITPAMRHADLDRYLGFGPSDDVLAKVMRGNALRLFGLDRS